jgi:NTP pyrophosphatase (non-canonical NTP hydrolase)
MRDPIKIDDCRSEVLQFAVLMERELRRNDHKGRTGWKNCRPLDLIERVRGEAEELRDLVRDNQVGTLAQPDLDCKRHEWARPLRTDIGSEAADVANMAMMVADVCGCLSPPPQSPLKDSEGEGI